MKTEVLTQAGIDYEQGLHRFMGKSAVYEKLLLHYLGDTAIERAGESFKRRDYDQLVRDVHEIKGSSGSMCLTPLYEAASALVALIRSGAYTDEEVEKSYSAVETTYADMKNAIQKATEE